MKVADNRLGSTILNRCNQLAPVQVYILARFNPSGYPWSKSSESIPLKHISQSFLKNFSITQELDKQTCLCHIIHLSIFH